MTIPSLTTRKDACNYLPLPGRECTDTPEFFRNAFQENITNEACTRIAKMVIANTELRGTLLYEIAQQILAALESERLHDVEGMKLHLLQLAYVKQICNR